MWTIIAVVVIGLLILWRLFSPADVQVEDYKPIEFQTFTPKTLQKYNGVSDPRVLMAVDGKVYDVSAGKAHYGPGGMYENFAGRDASRGLAKHSFEDDMLSPVDGPIDPLTDLNDDERAALKQWSEFFGGKYTHCGDLVSA